MSKNYINREELGKAADHIMSAFVWSKTPEGHNYWSNVLGKLINMREEYDREQEKAASAPQEIIVDGVVYVRKEGE